MYSNNNYSNKNISNKLNYLYRKQNNNITLTISSDNIVNCSYVAKKLQEMKILSNIRDNESVIKKGNKFVVEHGCEIKIHHIENKKIKKDLWIPLRNEYNLDCAHYIYLKNFQDVSMIF